MPSDITANQTGVPAHLSPVIPQAPQQPAAVGTLGSPAPGVTPQPAPQHITGSKEQAVQQAKQLVIQYRTTPFQLAGALQQLKSGYLAEQYHIAPSSGEK